MKKVMPHRIAVFAGLACIPLQTQATGFATCDSGPSEQWQRPSALEKKLTDIQWKVRRIKVDGGCFEVYGMNEKGERVEAYFHPVTLAPVPTKAW